ncbi:MAG: RPA12/RPB9/RPC11 RNA polymerase family protein [Candidatus Thalassarchaeaceae archaeon]|nr:hypothetical protein [Euryarchaeota archaeon]RCH75128.1 MAG: hypothetical protein DBX04_07670 [Candidatus Poseidoniales archaeon]
MAQHCYVCTILAGVGEMFCPECGTLGFMEPNGNIRCTNYTCGYEGPLTGKDGKGAEFTDPMTGETIDLSKARSSGEAKNLKHLTEVVEDEGGKGVLRVGDIRCPKCDKNEIFVILMQTRSSDEPETKICTCKNCGKKFREYQ